MKKTYRVPELLMTFIVYLVIIAGIVTAVILRTKGFFWTSFLSEYPAFVLLMVIVTMAMKSEYRGGWVNSYTFVYKFKEDEAKVQ